MAHFAGGEGGEASSGGNQHDGQEDELWAVGRGGGEGGTRGPLLDEDERKDDDPHNLEG
jgi:hypothetical protein